MIAGTYTSQANDIPVPIRDDLPCLIVGREGAVETLRHFAITDIHDGKPIAYFGAIENILPYVPKDRVKHCIVVEADRTRPTAFNIFRNVADEELDDLVLSILDGLAQVYKSHGSTPQLDRYMTMGIHAMCAIRYGTLYALPFLFRSEKYRRRVINQVKDEMLKDFLEEFDRLSDKDRRIEVQSFRNRLDAIVLAKSLRAVIGQTKSFALSDKSILLVDLPQSDNYRLLAALILSRVKGKAYIEYPHVHVGKSVPTIACSYLGQLPEPLLDRMLGTATIMSFRTGAKDERLLTPYFELWEQSIPLAQLQDGMAYVNPERTHLIYAAANSLKADRKIARKIRNYSRTKYGVPIERVLAKLSAFVANT